MRALVGWLLGPLILFAAAALLLMQLASLAFAHDEWANGQPVPAWVKHSCCGEADAHHLTPDQVQDMGDYYIVDGYHERIPKMVGGKPNSSILPSQDGNYWIFYGEVAAGKDCTPEAGCTGWHGRHETDVYCFFVPMDI